MEIVFRESGSAQAQGDGLRHSMTTAVFGGARSVAGALIPGPA